MHELNGTRRVKFRRKVKAGSSGNAGSKGTVTMSATEKEASSSGEVPASPPPKPEVKGWLYKWTNYIKGYQKRWFVLSNGLLSYYRNQAEMSHTCRGTISMHGSVITVADDGANFIVANGGNTQTFHLRASGVVERQKWITALEMAKSSWNAPLGGHGSDLEDDLEEADAGEITKQELINVIKLMSAKLEDLSTCSNLIGKHGTALQAAIAELTSNEKLMEKASPENRAAFKNLSKTVTERAALLKLTSNAMVKASNDFNVMCQNNGMKWRRVRE